MTLRQYLVILLRRAIDACDDEGAEQIANELVTLAPEQPEEQGQ